MINLIKQFVEIFKTWPVFFQFLYLVFSFYFTFSLVADIASKIAHFASNSLPIILHGWPSGAEVEEVIHDEEEQGEEENPPTDDKK